MADALDNHESTVSINGRCVSNSRFADDIDGLAVSKRRPYRAKQEVRQKLHKVWNGDQCRKKVYDT